MHKQSNIFLPLIHNNVMLLYFGMLVWFLFSLVFVFNMLGLIYV